MPELSWGAIPGRVPTSCGWRRQQVEPEDISQKDPVYWGTVLEPLVAKRFSEVTGKKVERCGTLQNNEAPWMLANIDRLVLGEGAGLEIKTTNAFRSAEWDGDQLPDSYYWQCQHYMMTTGLPLWYIAVLIGGQDFRWKAIPRNEEDIKELFLREEEFWNVNVLQHVMPGIDGSDCTREALKEQYPGGDMEELELTKDVDLLLMERQDVMEHLGQYKAYLQMYDNKLKALLGNHELATTLRASGLPTRPRTDEHPLTRRSWKKNGRTSTSRWSRLANLPGYYGSKHRRRMTAMATTKGGLAKRQAEIKKDEPIRSMQAGGQDAGPDQGGIDRDSPGSRALYPDGAHSPELQSEAAGMQPPELPGA